MGEHDYRCVYCGKPSGQFDEHEECVEASAAEVVRASAEKAQREAAARSRGPEKTIGMTGDRETFEDDPVDKKFTRVWDGSVPSGEPAKGGLKGY